MEAVQQSEKPSFLLLSSCSPQIQENQKEEGNWSNVIVLTEITASGFDGIYPILIYHLHEHTQHPGFGLNITGPNTELMKVWLLWLLVPAWGVSLCGHCGRKEKKNISQTCQR